MVDKPDDKDNRQEPEQWLNVRIQGNISVAEQTKTASATKRADPQQDAQPNGRWRNVLYCIGYPFKRAAKAIEPYSSLVTAVATGVIAAFTISLAQSSYEEWQTLMMAQHPYVSIGRKDGTMGTIIEAQAPDQKASVLLYFHNGGVRPAFNFNVQLLDFGTGGQKVLQHMARLGDKTGVVEQVGGGVAIAADSERQVLFPNWVKQSDVDSAKRGKKPISAWGIFEYCDEFGGYSCSFFGGEYEPNPPINASTFSCLGTVITLIHP